MRVGGFQPESDVTRCEKHGRHAARRVATIIIKYIEKWGEKEKEKKSGTRQEGQGANNWLLVFDRQQQTDFPRLARLSKNKDLLLTGVFQGRKLSRLIRPKAPVFFMFLFSF